MGRRDVGKAVFVAVVRLHGCLDVCSLGMHLGRTCLLYNTNEKKNSMILSTTAFPSLSRRNLASRRMRVSVNDVSYNYHR